MLFDQTPVGFIVEVNLFPHLPPASFPPDGYSLIDCNILFLIHHTTDGKMFALKEWKNEILIMILIFIVNSHFQKYGILRSFFKSKLFKQLNDAGILLL